MGVVVGGRGLGGAVVAGSVAVSVGGKGVGILDGAGCVSVGGGAAVGEDGLGLGMTAVGEAVGEGTGVELGWAAGGGRGVFVGRADATRVLVGVGVTAGLPGLHWMVSNATQPIPIRKGQSHRRFFIPRRIKERDRQGPRSFTCLKTKADSYGPSRAVTAVYTRFRIGVDQIPRATTATEASPTPTWSAGQVGSADVSTGVWSFMYIKATTRR